MSEIYSEAQLADLMRMREQGYTYKSIAKQLNNKYQTNLGEEGYRGLYRRHKDKFVPNQEEFYVKNLQDVARTKRNKSKTDKENKLILDYLNQLDDAKSKLEELAKNVTFKVHKPVKLQNSNKKTRRALLAHLSDTHYGVRIDRGELGGMNEFNNTIAARRTALFFQHLATYKEQHREETDLIVALNGDLGAGVIHNQENGVDLMTDQFGAILSNLSQGLSYVAQRFRKIRVVCTPGNHLRFQHKANKGRPGMHKWDSFATLAYISLKRELESRFPNVYVDIPQTPYAIIQVLGHKIFATHGDDTFDIGNPSKTISMDSFIKQINAINTSELAEDGKFNLFIFGHVHTPTAQILDNSSWVMINGCLSGLDPHAQSIGIFGNNPVQQFVELTNEHIGDMRFVELKEADSQKQLDKIIEPYQGLFNGS